MFKVGDKVRRINHDNSPEFKVGQTGVVIKSSLLNVKVDGSGYESICLPKNLELVEEKKPRQRYYLVADKEFHSLENAKKFNSEGDYVIREVELVATYTPNIPKVTYTRKEI